MSWLWVTVTRLATVFTIAGHRSGEVDAALLRSLPTQVVGSDRFSSYAWITTDWRQICWAHLRSDFQAMIDRSGTGKAIGERLLKRSHRLFHHWHRVRDGTLDWEMFVRRKDCLRREFRHNLEDGLKCSCAPTASTCFEILKVEEGLRTVARARGLNRRTTRRSGRCVAR